MSFFSNFRLPYRNDYLFGCLLLVALLIPLAFDVYNFESFEIVKFGLLMLLVGISAVFFIKKYFSKNTGPLVLRISKAFFLGLVLFFLWAFLSTALAEDKNYSFFGFYPRFTNGLLFYFVWTSLFLLLAGLNKNQIWILIKLLFFCASLTALWGLLQSLGWGYYAGVSMDFFSRSAPSFLGNPNFSSMFVAALAPLGLYFFAGSKSFSGKAYYALSLFLQIWSIVIFASRGALLALIIGFSVCLFFAFIFFKRSGVLKFGIACALALGLACVLALGFLNFSRPQIAITSLTLNEANINTRLGVWGMTLDSILKKPFFGHGLGNFELVFEQNRSLTSIKNGFFDDPHNLLLYLAVSGGLPFLFLFLFLFFYPALVSLKKLFQVPARENNLQIIALFGCLSAWLAGAFFTPVAIPCYALLAFLLNAFFQEPEVYPLPKFRILRPLSFGAFGILVIYSLSFLLAEHLFFGGIRAYNAHDFLKSNKLVKTAIYLNPFNNLYYEYLAGSAIRAGLPQNIIDSSISSFSRFHPQRAYTYIQLANIYYLLFYQTRDFKFQAPILENVNLAVSLDPFSSGHYFSLSQFYFAFGDLENSKAALQKGLRLDSNLEGIMFLAKIYQYQNNRRALIETLQLALGEGQNQIEIVNLIRLAKSTPEITSLPFNVGLSIGRLD